MKVENFHKFLTEIGLPLGVPSYKIQEFMKKISVLDIHTYENKKYVFYYDVLLELSKFYMIEAIINDQIGDGKIFRNKNAVLEEKTELWRAMHEE
jgi:hypothetical protein